MINVSSHLFYPCVMRQCFIWFQSLYVGIMSRYNVHVQYIQVLIFQISLDLIMDPMDQNLLQRVSSRYWPDWFNQIDR